MSNREELKQRARGISLGLYAGDLGALADTARTAQGWGAQVLHFDEMDGNFVPGFLGGAPLVGAVRKALPEAFLDVHLMHAQPEKQVGAYEKAGADLITVHAETAHAAAALEAIRGGERPMLAGLALMPGTTPDPALIALADLVLVLSLDPRDGAAPDISAACARLEALRKATAEHQTLLAFDGGVTLEVIDQIAAARPDLIVSGSAVMKQQDPRAAFEKMVAAARKPHP